MQELIRGAGIVIAYILLLASIMLSARAFIKIPDELFRKLLHFVLLGAYFPFLFAFETWWISAGFAAFLIAVIYPILMLAERIPMFSSFVNERKKGEFKSSMVLALMMIIISISVCWGGLNDRWLVLACVYAWGVGDAFAALVGKRYGRHKITWKYADGHKSVEGTVAMFLSSSCSVFVLLMIRGGLNQLACLFVSCLAAIVCALVELCSTNGVDTMTCPLAAMLVIIPVVLVIGG